MKRGYISIGLLLAAVYFVWLGQANNQRDVRSPQDEKMVSVLQRQYEVDKDQIRLGKWQVVLASEKILSPAERQMQIQKLQTELSGVEQKQTQLNAAAADKEQAMQAVNKDFSNGKLSAADRDMLLNLFRQNMNSHQQQLAGTKRQMEDLQLKLQGLKNTKDPDVFAYSQAQIDLGEVITSRTVFYNKTVNRPADEMEMAANPAIQSIQSKYPISTKLKYNARPIFAGALLLWGLFTGYLLLYNYRDQKKRKRIYYGTGIQRQQNRSV